MKLAGLLRERLALHATLGRQAFEARMGEEARRLSKFNFGPEMLQAGRKGGGGARGRGKGRAGRVAGCTPRVKRTLSCGHMRCTLMLPSPHTTPHPTGHPTPILTLGAADHWVHLRPHGIQGEPQATHTQARPGSGGRGRMPCPAPPCCAARCARQPCSRCPMLLGPPPHPTPIPTCLAPLQELGKNFKTLGGGLGALLGRRGMQT